MGEKIAVKNRVNKLRALFSKSNIDAILITSESNRKYLSGFTGSTGYLLVSEQEALFITDFRYVDQAKEQCPDFVVIDNERKMNQALKDSIEKLNIRQLGFEKDHVTYGQYSEWKGFIHSAQLVPTSGLIEELRLIKDETEIGHIRKAVEIADQTFTHILGVIRPGVKEEDIAIEMEFYMRKLGASGASFDTIVASGVRSALPHGRASSKVIQEGELVTLDFGAIYNGYVSDITRTVAVGEVSSQLKEIYAVCLDAQLTGVNNIKAGMSGKEADALCRDVITKAGYGDNFGHSTGHGIGLEVHEGPNASVASEIILQPGMLLTVEPGIYISGIGGVRIEDDIIITTHGNEILSKSTKELLILG